MERVGLLSISLWLSVAVLAALSVAATENVLERGAGAEAWRVGLEVQIPRSRGRSSHGGQERRHRQQSRSHNQENKPHRRGSSNDQGNQPRHQGQGNQPQQEGNSRNLMQELRQMGCSKNRTICRVSKVSAGPHCCKNRCVNKKVDPNNCGECGKVCKKGRACCNGRCINLRTDTKNCGSCGRQCNTPKCAKARGRRRKIEVSRCPKPTCIAGLCNYGYGYGV